VRRRAARLALGCTLALLACADAAEEPDPVIARLDGQPIRRSEVSAPAAFRLYRHQVASYALLEQEAERLVEERLLAAEAQRRGLAPDELLARVEAEAAAPSEADVDRYLAEHAAAAEGAPDSVRPRVRLYLEQSARIERRLAFLAELRERARFEWLLAKPVAPRTRIEAPEAPARGPRDAPVTIVHLASFGSAASARSARALARLSEELPQQVRWLHVNLPGENDDAGRRAAELGFAAQRAGRFWELHDALFAREGRLDPAALGAALREAGLPVDLLQQSDRVDLARRVEADAALGRRTGALREPTLFVNGRYWSAPGSYADLRRLVEDELAQRTAGR
jgi:hypothetical protein